MRLAPPRWAGPGKALQAPRIQRSTTDQPAFWLFLSFRIPRRAAAVAHVAGEGDGAARAVFLAVAALHQFGGGLVPCAIALDALAGSHSDMGWSSRWRARSLVI